MRVPWFLALAVLLGPPLSAREVVPRIDVLQIQMVQRVSQAVVALTCSTNTLSYYGTGTLISGDGKILTNISVIPPHGKDIQVFFRNGQIHRATIVEYDVKTESILLQISAKGPFPFISLGDSSKVTLGQRVYTFGNPYLILQLDAQVAVAAGAISAIGQVTDNAEDQQQSSYRGSVLETDAAVNPGSDGGPFVDSAGQLVGVMSLAYQRERLLGTAIPVHLIARRMRALKDYMLRPPPKIVLSPATRVLSRQALKVAQGVVWLEIDREDEAVFELPKGKDWEKLNVFEQSAYQLRKLMQRPRRRRDDKKSPVGAMIRATGVAIEDGRYVLTSAYHFAHNREHDPKAPRPLIKSIKIHGQGMRRALRGQLISRFDSYDLALVKVIGGRLKSSLELGNSTAMPEGKSVGVLGRQRGSKWVTMTQGVISASGRKFNLVKAFQTNALVNYANLGGPVIDLDGQVVGLATHLNPDADFGLNSGVGLFTGSETIKQVLGQMKAGRYQKNPPLPFLGIRAWLSRSFGGAAVAGVNMGSGAYKAGVRPGDLIVSVDGSPVGEWSDLIRAITGKRIGQKISFEVQRDGKRLKLEATLGRREW